jgi:adenine specific DNA methylase Mod
MWDATAVKQTSLGDTGLNKLYYGDNLPVLQEHVATESVNLIYLDPPFNSDRIHNVLFREKGGGDSPAQIQAFDDTWTWSQETESLYIGLLSGQAPLGVAAAMEAMQKLLGEGDLLAYLTMMAARLLELHRVLRLSGSIFLHCDPTASHYLKVLCDAIFGSENFRNEIIWQRTQAKSLMSRQFQAGDRQ